MYCCYIIFSEKLNRYYIGFCQEDLSLRIEKHNQHSYGNHRFTAKAADWKLVLNILCDSNSQALKIEKHIKSMKSRIYIDNLIKYPEMLVALKEKYII